MKPLPVGVHEMLVAPAALALAAVHARRALGAAAAARELVVLVAYGFGLEWLTMRVFTSHTYGTAWTAAPGGVPVAVALVWAALIVSAMAIAARLPLAGGAARALAAALTGIGLDLLMEPVALRAGLWTWTPPGPWLGVPVGNFVGWTVIVGAYAYGAERWSDGGHPLAALARRAALAAGSVALLVAVGIAWTRAGAERAFRGPGGWAAWGLLLGLGAGMAATTAPKAALSERITEPGLATRLGRAPGSLPASVFLLLAAVFTFDAAALAEPALAVAALGTVATLAFILSRIRS